MVSLILLKNKVEHVEFALAQITTGYNLEDDRCECVALQDYKKNEQVNSHLELCPACRFLHPANNCMCVEAIAECDDNRREHTHPPQPRSGASEQTLLALIPGFMTALTFSLWMI